MLKYLSTAALFVKETSNLQKRSVGRLRYRGTAGKWRSRKPTLVLTFATAAGMSPGHTHTGTHTDSGSHASEWLTLTWL